MEDAEADEVVEVTMPEEDFANDDDDARLLEETLMEDALLFAAAKIVDFDEETAMTELEDVDTVGLGLEVGADEDAAVVEVVPPGIHCE